MLEMGQELLYKAAKEGDITQIERLMAAGVTPDMRVNGKTPLYAAVKKGHVEAARQLITWRADIHSADLLDRSPLHIAVEQRNFTLVELLVGAGANISTIDAWHRNPLHIAVEKADVLLAQYLIHHGADKEAVCVGKTPLHCAIEKNDLPMIECLVSLGADIEKPFCGRTPLHMAVRAGNIPLVQCLIALGANKEGLYNDKTPLHIAVDKGYCEVIRELITLGADKEATYYDETPLIAAVKRHGRLDVIQLLITLGADVNARDFAHHSALHWAILEGYVKIVLFFIGTCSASLDFENKYQAICRAIQRGHVLILTMLLREPSIEALVHERNNAILKAAQRLALSFPKQYQPIVNRLLQIRAVYDIYHIEESRITSLFENVDPDYIAYGPLNKNIYTQTLEWIAKYALRHPQATHFFVEDETFYVNVQNEKINLSELFKQANLSHISLTKEDSHAFGSPAYLAAVEKIPAEEWVTQHILKHPQKVSFSFENEVFYFETKNGKVNFSEFLKQANLPHISLMKEDNPSLGISSYWVMVGKLPADYCLAGEYLTNAEIFSIHHYTGDGFGAINYLLHAELSDKARSKTLDQNVFFYTLFLASGLNKIAPTWTEEGVQKTTYRAEGSIQSSELNKRLQWIRQNPQGYIYKQLGFASTSSNPQAKVVNRPHNLSLMELDRLYGKNIMPLSIHPVEEEYLILPSHFLITKHVYDPKRKLNVFKAKPITPLLEETCSLSAYKRLKRLMARTPIECLTEQTRHQLAREFETHADPLSYLLDVCDYVYRHYLSKSFTDVAFPMDWELMTSQGLIYRPNHGLAHVMRVAHMVPLVAKAFCLSEREIYIIQVTALFSVVGRQSEAGFKDMLVNQGGYKAYKQGSADAFVKYIHENNFLEMTPLEIAQYHHNILKMGEPGENTPSAIVLALAHKLDLLRCYSPERVQNDIVEPLQQYFSEGQIDALMHYSESLLHATGNRVLYGKQVCGYDPELFYSVSTMPKVCLNAITCVNPPECVMASQKMTITPHP